MRNYIFSEKIRLMKLHLINKDQIKSKWEKKVLSFKREKNTSQRKNSLVECAQGDQPVRCQLVVICRGGDVTCFDVVCCGGEMKHCGWLSMTWVGVIWSVVRWHVMSCYVMQSDAMWCGLMWWIVICCEVRRCNGMGFFELVMRCGWLKG